jgi:hypothetical protein
MKIRAIAFSESVKRGEMARRLKEYAPLIFTSGFPLPCGSCGAAFTAFFVIDPKEDNTVYAESLKVRIAQDCDNGKHPDKVEEKSYP